MSLNDEFLKIGLRIPNILLPNENVNLNKFSVIAADQFSAEKDYWNKVKQYVSNEPSTYNLIFPEANMPITDEKINDINNYMNEYLNNGILKNYGECFIYVKRETSAGVRNGLILAIDLEQYDYSNNSKSLIRATEGTVEDRLPIRVKIKKNASIDLPHVMIMINDKTNSLFNYIKNIKDKLNKIYDFNLMFNDSNIKGYLINDNEHLKNLLLIFNKLKQQCVDNLMYAVGDGNHSLASAKICYEEEKKNILNRLNEDQLSNKEYIEELLINCKKRYALVELVNIYDKGIQFYPIHRLLINCKKDNFEKEMNINLNDKIPLQPLQKIIDEYMLNHKEVKLEYIHGKENCEKLGQIENNISITFDEFSKDGFFDDINKYGSLCRKSFSIGKDIDKRYYLESMSYI